MRVTGGLVDVSLAQTLAAGLTYACLPVPWLSEWADFNTEHGGSAFAWQDTCGLPGWDLSQAEQDDDGNVWICLLEPDHVGMHGWSHVR